MRETEKIRVRVTFHASNPLDAPIFELLRRTPSRWRPEIIRQAIVKNMVRPLASQAVADDVGGMISENVSHKDNAGSQATAGEGGSGSGKAAAPAGVPALSDFGG